MKVEGGLCRLLDWDSEFFGFRIARLQQSALTPLILSDVFNGAIVKKCDASISWYLRISRIIELAEASGFRMADIRITLVRELGANAGSTKSVRAFRESDLASLRAIAAVSHRDSRFYNDLGFPDQRCDELYQTWIERSCRGYADSILVAEHCLEPAGYVSCHLESGGIGILGCLPWRMGRAVWD